MITSTKTIGIRALALKWLPHDITKEEIIKIFNNDYGEITLNQVVVQKTKGRQIGNALVILESCEYAQNAKLELNQEELKHKARKIEFFDHNDLFFKTVCELDEYKKN